MVNCMLRVCCYHLPRQIMKALTSLTPLCPCPLEPVQPPPAACLAWNAPGSPPFPLTEVLFPLIVSWLFPFHVLKHVLMLTPR